MLNYIKTDIISGNIKSGDKLPSVREYASMFKVNPNTMQKALIELENLGLIYTERTNGKFVTTDKKVIEKAKKASKKGHTGYCFRRVLCIDLNIQIKLCFVNINSKILSKFFLRVYSDLSMRCCAKIAQQFAVYML